MKFILKAQHFEPVAKKSPIPDLFLEEKYEGQS